MKLLKFILIIAAGCLWQLPCSAGQPDFCLTSPDHPPAWYNRSGDKLSQYLTWDNSKQQLMLRVAYSNVAYTPAVWRDQTFVDSFQLRFPTVRLDQAKNHLYFVDNHRRKISLGHLEPGIFGTQVKLNDNVDFSAHRQNGVVNGTIRSVGSPAP